MIAVDTSAIYALLNDEPDARRIRDRLMASRRAVMSSGTMLELQLVAAGAGRNNWDEVEQIFSTYQIAILSFDALQLSIARDAVLRYGRGRHPARLNFGDCFAYALAKSEGIPLLYVGGDFAKTDIEAA